MTHSRKPRLTCARAAITLAMVLTTTARAADPQLVINELMYHAYTPWPSNQPYASTNLSEYVELFNAGTTTVNLAGYRFDNGIDLTFTNGTLAPGAYGVVCENRAVFTNRYPAVASILGQYAGSLNNGGERVTLSRLDTNGNWVTEDTIEYLDDFSSDGTDNSLELVHPGFARLRDMYAGDWLASNSNGTPGAVNNRYLATPLPVAGDLTQDAALPPPGSAVKITARVSGRDGQTTISNPALTVRLEYRRDTNPQGAYTNTPMQDAGVEGDAVANDGMFTAFLPPYGSGLVTTNGDMFEFRVAVSDALGSRTFPATNRSGVAAGPYSCLVKFGEDTFADAAYPGEYETFHMLMTAANKSLLQTRPVTSDDLIDATIVVNNRVYYNGGVRLRGGTSRDSQLGNYRIELPNGTDLDGYSKINLNHFNALRQHIGMVVTDIATGGYAFDSHLARVYLNHERKNPSQGIYHRFETFGAKMMTRIYGSNDRVNYYSADGDFRTGYLQYVGETESSYYSLYYLEQGNPYTAWGEMVDLSRDLNAPTDQYPSTLTNRMNVPLWGTLFGAQVALDNKEAGFLSPHSAYGDELRLTVNPANGRFDIFPWDYDDVVGSSALLWGFNTGVAGPTVNKFLFNQPIVPYYVGQVRDIIRDVMSATNMAALFTSMGSKMDSVELSYLNTIAIQRTSLLNQIATNLTVNGLAAGAPVLLCTSTNAGAALAVNNVDQNGSPRWQFLGALSFPDASATVRLVRQFNQPSRVSIADAIMISNAVAGATIVEDSGPAFSTTGTWISPADGGFGGGGYHASSNASSTATWTANLPQSGPYSVYAWVFTPTNGLSEAATRYELASGQAGLTLNLGGTAPQSYTAQVTVNGVPTSWNLRTNAWSMTNTLVLAGDVADVVVRALHPEGAINKQLAFQAVALRAPQLAPTTITGTSTWSSASGTFVVSNDVTVAANGKLIVGPRTTVLFAPGKRLIVNGALELAGTPGNPARLFPYGGTNAWSIEASGSGASVVLSNAVLMLGHVVATSGARLHIADSVLGPSANTNGIIQTSGAASAHLSRSILRDFVLTRFETTPTLVDQCLLERMSSAGILFSGAAATATVSRTTLRAPAGTDGIRFVNATAGLVTNVLVQDMRGTGVVANASTVQLVNALLDSNQTGLGLAGASSVQILDSTVVGGNIGILGSAAITNTVAWNVVRAVTNGPASAAYSDLQQSGNGVYAGTANLNRDPFFRDPATRDYQVLGISPCVGTGVGGTDMGVAYPTGANPAAPAGLTLLPGSNAMYLGWADLSADETGFEVYRSNGGNAWSLVATTAPNATNHTDTGLEPDDSYYYRVRAVHARGESTYTDVISERTTPGTMTEFLRDYLRITEVHYNPAGSSDDTEFIEFKNASTNHVLDLTGLYLDSGRFAFSNGTTLLPQQFFVLARLPAAFASAYPSVAVGGGFADPNNRLDNAGEQLWVKDAASVDVLRFSYDDGNSGGVPDNSWYPATDGGGFSLVTVETNPLIGDPDSDLFWRASANAGGSPGADDPEPAGSGIVINEVLAHTDPPLEDAIEIRNTGSTPVNISGWYLSDDPQNLWIYHIPAMAPIPAGGYVVFYEGNSFNQVPGNTNYFGISELGDETIFLSATTGGNELTGYRAQFGFVGAVEKGVSFGRHVRSDGQVDFTAMSSRSFGVDNPGSVAHFRTGTGLPNPAPKVGPVSISEIMYNPGPGGNEYVELHNISGTSARLYNTNFAPTNAWNTWQFDAAFEYVFPTGTVLAVDERVLLSGIPPAQFRTQYAIDPAIRIFGPFDGDLNNSAETLKLYKPDNPETNGLVPRVIVDRVQYRDSAPWPALADNGGASLERIADTGYGNEPTNWVGATLGGTPGLTNNTTGAASVGFADVTDSRVEAGEVVMVDVSIYPSQSTTVSVHYAVTGGTATPNTDYSLAAGSLIFWPHETTKAIALTIIDDAIPSGEPNETIEVTLTNVVGSAFLGGNRVYTHTIVDADVTNSQAVAAPVILPVGPTDFTNAVTITMVPTVVGSRIRYTLDGTAPDSSDPLYEGPFVLDRAALVTARTFLGDLNQGNWTSALFRARSIPPGWMPPPPLPANAVLLGITAALDDGYQNKGTGSTAPTTPTIALATNGTLSGDGNYGALFRFNGVGIPQGVVVTNAYLEFTAAADNSVTAFTTIRGEATNNAAALAAVVNNIRNRSKTTNAVHWAIPPWITSERGSNQRTPNLAALVTEIVNRPGWALSNSLAIMLTNSIGNGARTVHAFDGSPGQAAAFYAEWAVPQGLFYFAALTNGAGVVTGGNVWVAEGSNASATADAAYGYAFLGWTGDTGAGDTNATTLTVTMTIDRTVTANFVLLPPPPPAQVLSTESAGSNGFTVRWQSTPIYLYSVHRTTNLILAPLGVMLTNGMPAHPSGTNTYTDTAATNAVHFYSIGADFPP